MSLKHLSHVGLVVTGERFAFLDLDADGLDAGRERQANILQALFNSMEHYPGS